MKKPVGGTTTLMLAGLLAIATALPIVTDLGRTAAGASQVAPAGAADLRQRIDLNPGWKFTRTDVPGAERPDFDATTWQDVSAPHTWNADDGADGGDDYFRGIGWYRRHYTVPPTLDGKQLYLQFAGVNQVADVWVNGVHLGQHEGGYTRFRFNATDALKVGADNVIAVKVDNSPDPDIAPLRADYSFDGGIYRNVSLWAVDPLQVRMLDNGGPGVYLRQREVTDSSATVEVTTRLWNNNTGSSPVAVRATVTDADGSTVAAGTTTPRQLAAGSGTSVVQSLTIADPRRWNGIADPYQYQVRVELIDSGANRVTDVVTEPLGLRTFRVDADKGFILNGKQLPLHGVNLHQDRSGKGWAIDNADHKQDLEIIGEMGANAIRMAHYPHDQIDYGLADAKGFVVWAEIPFINDYTGSTAFRRNVEQQLVEMIRQNYNHPSIVFWGIGNEQRVADAATNDLLSGLSDLADTEDPDRITTYASCCISDRSQVNGHAETSSYNKYYGWYSKSWDSLGTWADKLHAADPGRKISVSEYGAGANINQHELAPEPPETTGRWHPEEYQALFHEASLKQFQARPFIWGSFVWNMFDFASDRRSEGDQPGINDKGLVTRDRAVRKDAFYWYKANWADTATLHINSRRWTERTDPVAEIKVYSNASQVTATLNGRPLGTRSSSDRIFRWTDVTLEPGGNLVEVTATIDGIRHTDTVSWHLGERPADSRIEAESRDEQSGTQLQDTADVGGGLNVGYLHQGDLLGYRRVDFGRESPRTIATRIASGSAAVGSIDVRLDGPSGPRIASVPVGNTGGWQTFSTTATALTSAPTGVRDVYLTFTGSTKNGIVNLNWLTFRR
ncbi:carbohydrate-binding protein [Nakamurella lactea]|uniref:carbohydrate-binding protein n=1 Tax=Nakamurella lactea TaxID=459515 RepID=UPI00040B2C1D|nr:carbohydrate-binding protein [Nakamurella lactea]